MQPTASRPLTGSAVNQPGGLGDCSICFESLDGKAEFNSRTVKSCTPCGHIYHRECLDTNMRYNRRCPNCRSEINPENIVVFFEGSLHKAVEKGSLPLVKGLIGKSVDDLNELNEQGETILMLAARKGNLEIIKTLIDHGANPAICTKDNVTAFDMAQNDNIRSHLAKVFIERSIATGTHCDNAGRDITHYLTELNCPELRTVLQKTNIDVNILTASLHVAFHKGKTDIAEVLIDCGTNINIPSDQEGSTWLYRALKSKNWIVTEKLMAAGANLQMPVNINEEGTVFDQTVKHFELSGVSFLIQKGIIKFDQLTQGNISTLYFWAVETPEDRFIFDFMTENGVDFNLRDKNGETALHVAVRKNFDKKSIIRLTGLGVDVKAINSRGETALHLSAAQRFSLYALDVLITAGADVNARAYDGSTPLHRAAQNGGILNTCLLIDRGACQTTLNHDGKTALQLAAENNEARTVYAFLSRGGDYATCTENGDMLFDLFPPGDLISAFRTEDALPLISNPDRPCNRDGSTLLSYAIDSKDTVVINKLLKSGASTDNLYLEQVVTLLELTDT